MIDEPFDYFPGKECGDGTSVYTVIINGTPTLEECIDRILDTHMHGIIIVNIMKDCRNPENPKVRYSNGEILSTLNLQGIFGDLLQYTVTEGFGHGGYGRSDFVFEVEI